MIRKARKITDNNLQTFKEELEMKNWTTLLTIDDPLRAYKDFPSEFQTLYNKHFPIITVLKR